VKTGRLLQFTGVLLVAILVYLIVAVAVRT
jgi:hypothetical protein